jgi:hypothetical protein
LGPTPDVGIPGTPPDQQEADGVEAALGGGQDVKSNVRPSGLRSPSFAESLLDSVAKTGASERATRRSRTGDLLITNRDQGETESNQDEPSPQKTEDSD